MSELIASRTAREETEIGTYAALCIDVYDAGWWKNLEGGYTNKCKVVFYLGKHEITGRDLFIDAFESLTLGKKANLTKLVEQWVGRPLTPDELKSFDLKKLVGGTALIQVTQKPKQDGTPRSVIGSIMRLPKGMSAPTAPEEYVKDEDRDETMASKFPRPEAKAATAKAANAFAQSFPEVAPAPATPPAGGEDFPNPLADEDDDLPF